MNMFKKTFAVSSIVLGLATIPLASAQAGGGLFPVGDRVEKPWYFGAAIGATQLEPSVLISGGSVTDDTSEGLQVYGGYKFNQRFAFEAFYADLGKAQVDVVTDTSPVEYQAFGLGLVGSYPLTKKVSVLGKLGVVQLENEVKPNFAYRQVQEYAFHKGIGMEYKMSDTISLRMMYDHYDKDYEFFSIGFQINF